MAAGFLSKGTNALFPLLLPVIIGLYEKIFPVNGEKKDSIALSQIPFIKLTSYFLASCILLLCTISVLSIFWLFPEPRYNLNTYFKNQVFASLWGNLKRNELGRLDFLDQSISKQFSPLGLS